jgi:hypothetical protein
MDTRGAAPRPATVAEMANILLAARGSYLVREIYYVLGPRLGEAVAGRLVTELMYVNIVNRCWLR